MPTDSTRTFAAPRFHTTSELRADGLLVALGAGVGAAEVNGQSLMSVATANDLPSRHRARQESDPEQMKTAREVQVRCQKGSRVRFQGQVRECEHVLSEGM